MKESRSSDYLWFCRLSSNPVKTLHATKRLNWIDSVGFSSQGCFLCSLLWHARHSSRLHFTSLWNMKGGSSRTQERRPQHRRIDRRSPERRSRWGTQHSRRTAHADSPVSEGQMSQSQHCHRRHLFSFASSFGNITICVCVQWTCCTQIIPDIENEAADVRLRFIYLEDASSASLTVPQTAWAAAPPSLASRWAAATSWLTNG